jgi:hypothetical protein
MKERDMMTEGDLELAREADVRRLARFVGIVEHDTMPVPLLIYELAWKGVIRIPWPTGCY